MTLGLIVNAGSSSVKAAILADDLSLRAAATVTEIGGRSELRSGSVTRAVEAPDHRAAMRLILDTLGVSESDLDYAAHRVVHGGEMTGAQEVTPEIEAAIEAAIPLAPLHNPANLAGILAVRAAMPALLQSASFDTAFHATIPAVRRRYAIPDRLDARGIRPYGFHGLSYAALVRRLPEVSGAPLPARLLACHLGNGASLCAIYEGRSVATTMGYSPLSGLVMGSRAGDIDANAVLRIAEEEGIDAARRILNRESGLRALGGASDMRALEAAGADQAIAAFIDSVALHAGAMASALTGVDAVVFTGGIGENAAGVRSRIVASLGWLGLAPGEGQGPALHAAGSAVSAWVVPADEEAEIAREAMAVLGRV